MGLVDFIKKQFIDVIEWTESTDGVLAWRYPFEDREIQNGANHGTDNGSALSKNQRRRSQGQSGRDRLETAGHGVDPGAVDGEGAILPPGALREGRADLPLRFLLACAIGG